MDFCTKCGTRLENGICPNCDKPQQSVDDDKYKSFFVNPKERFVCSLGNIFIQNYLASGIAGEGFAVVSDKRVYFNGKTYEVSEKKIRKTTESKTVDLKDVTGTSVKDFVFPVLKTIGRILLILSVIILVVGVFSGSSGYSFGAIVEFFGWSFTFLVFFAIVFPCINYFQNKKRGIKSKPFPIASIILLVFFPMIFLANLIKTIEMFADNDSDGFLALIMLVLAVASLVWMLICFAHFEKTNKTTLKINPNLYKLFFTFSVLFCLSEFIFASGAFAIVAVILALITLIAGLILYVNYIKSRKSLLTISFAGGNIAFDISWYSSDESENFQKMLRQAKDAAVEEAENAAANAMREVMSGIAAPPVQAVQPQAAVLSADELAKYAQLYKDGMLSEEEFTEIKSRLLSK